MISLLSESDRNIADFYGSFLVPLSQFRICLFFPSLVSIKKTYKNQGKGLRFKEKLSKKKSYNP